MNDSPTVSQDFNKSIELIAGDFSEMPRNFETRFLVMRSVHVNVDYITNEKYSGSQKDVFF